MSSVLQPKKTNERLPQSYIQRATAALSSLSHICSRRRKLACAPPRVYKNRKILPSIIIITSRSYGTRSLSLSPPKGTFVTFIRLRGKKKKTTRRRGTTEFVRALDKIILQHKYMYI
ncbi:hypothetical protein IscW_ISCW017883 [Ixodes scapularis]|uniref:Uncharacterized protein n=1 Tax=Ixodes scapularis TaxID=6945 RepID=B7PIY4_IXOSC|nr:hypothetical protein IscW_ISCW017883 [Ixodes scapularis]|eukprot:XP_002406613.1 hypothetical protein IscW_ISCW017883 [Ixodes scapularis]